VPAPGFTRSNEGARTVPARNYPDSNRHLSTTYDPSRQYEHGRRISTASYGSHTPSHPQVVEKTRSMTPVTVKPILKSSRTRSLSMSSNPEGSRQSVNATPTRQEPRRSSLSKSHTVTVHRTAALKEEAISLSWPLVQFAARKRLRKPLLYFDIGFDPRQSKNLMDKRTDRFLPLQEADRNLPASTHCSLTKMVIECPHIGRITVRRSEGIRCLDIFCAIYDAYHKRLRRDERPKDIDRYMRAFKKRCEDSPSSEAELRAGLRWVDLLRGKRIFDGLSRSGADWKLDIDERS